jgi:hypothetical protein
LSLTLDITKTANLFSFNAFIPSDRALYNIEQNHSQVWLLASLGSLLYFSKLKYGGQENNKSCELGFTYLSRFCQSSQ